MISQGFLGNLGSMKSTPKVMCEPTRTPLSAALRRASRWGPRGRPRRRAVHHPAAHGARVDGAAHGDSARSQVLQDLAPAGMPRQFDVFFT